MATVTTEQRWSSGRGGVSTASNRYLLYAIRDIVLCDMLMVGMVHFRENGFVLMTQLLTISAASLAHLSDTFYTVI